MYRKFLKAFAIIFSCVLFFTGFSVFAQTSQLKIISVNKDNMVFGGNVHVKGQAMPNATILLSVKDEKDAFAYTVKTNSDSQGIWSANFDQLLKSGKYYIEAVQEDSSGVALVSVKSGPIEITGSYAFIVSIFSILVIILAAGFIAIWYINKSAEIKRYRRVLVSQRDVVSSYNILKNDVDKALKNLAGDKAEEWKISESEFLLKRISENLEKMNKYVLRGISIIGKYDIISKIDNAVNFKSKSKLNF